MERYLVFGVAEKRLKSSGASQPESIDLAAELRARDVSIRNVSERLRQSEKYSVRERGAAWQLAGRYRSWRERTLPAGSGRRNAYEALMRRVRKVLGGLNEES